MDLYMHLSRSILITFSLFILKTHSRTSTLPPIPGPPGLGGPPGTGTPGTGGPLGLAGPPGTEGPQGTGAPPGTGGPPATGGNPGTGGPNPSPLNGEAGPTGSSGPKGEKGAAGPEGPMGRRGRPGITGFDGRVGPQGLAGPIGPAGRPGQPGLSSTSKFIFLSRDNIPSAIVKLAEENMARDGRQATFSNSNADIHEQSQIINNYIMSLSNPSLKKYDNTHKPYGPMRLQAYDSQFPVENTISFEDMASNILVDRLAGFVVSVCRETVTMTRMNLVLICVCLIVGMVLSRFIYNHLNHHNQLVCLKRNLPMMYNSISSNIQI